MSATADHFSIKGSSVSYSNQVPPPLGKHTQGTFMSSNDLVNHQTHKNG